jgi:hypothetical protein
MGEQIRRQTMILVRLVFQAKFGHAAQVVAGFKQAAEIARSAGEKGPHHVRILTDLSGPFDTVIQELEYDSLDDFMKAQAAMFADPRWQEMARNGGFGDGVVSGSKEFYTVEFAE